MEYSARINDKSAFKGIFFGAAWGILSKIIAGIANFITVPFLIAFYGKANYGLIALSFSLNAYLRLMELGVGTGAVRFFSLWFTNKDKIKVQKVSQSSIIFYGVLGIINAVVFLLIANFSDYIFEFTNNQNQIFKLMMYILSATSIINWTSNVITQLLTATREISWLNKVSFITSILNIAVAYLAVTFNFPLTLYFLLYIISTIILIPINILRLKVTNIPISELLRPNWHPQVFKEVFKYSISIFAMGIFQFSADYLRPIILGSLSSNGPGVLTEFRILQTFGMLITMIGGGFINIILPYSTKAFATNDKFNLNLLMFQGTKYISILLSFLIFILVCNSKLLLILYVGNEYSHLSLYLNIWLITLLYLHNAPVSSMILATGKTKFLVWLAAFSSIICLSITAFFASQYNVGAAVIGYLIYIIVHLLGDYFYNIPKVLKLNSLRIFSSVFPSVIVGSTTCLIVYYTNNLWQNLPVLSQIVINSVIFICIYILLSLSFVIKKDELQQLFFKIKG